MRTTIDLPQDLHDLARQLAYENKRSMSDVIAQLIRLGLRQTSPPPRPDRPDGRGMPSVSVGRPVSAEDVRSLEDDD
ncbi:MAG: hypothetical protein R2698_02000 [Microthrixaceae bacterium]